jgi:LysM repeat protein
VLERNSHGKLVSFIKPQYKIFSSVLIPSLLLGSFFVPYYKVEASFFSDLFSNDASASTNITSEISETNSQNIGLLEANVSSATVMEDKKDKNSKDEKIDEKKEVSILSENALLPATGPAGVSDGTDGDIFSDQMSVYVVRKDDSIGKIAEMFDVSVNTIRWANDLKVGQKLKEGDVLIILPVSGVKHTVTKGQTIKSIAQKYKVEVGDITDFNGLSSDAKLAVGDELIIPDAEMIDNGGSTTKVASKKSTKEKDYYIKHPTPNLGGYFINPVPGYKRKSQGIHGGPTRNGVDLAASTGTPIVAAASGTVIFARVGYNGGYGNMVIISHPNGTETLYAHQSKLATQVGSKVSQGEIIGYVGSTGHSTGPHIHYEVHGAVNNANSL